MFRKPIGISTNLTHRLVCLFTSLLLALALFLLAMPVFALPSTFSWVGKSWPSGLNQSYSAGSPTVTLDFTFSGDTNRLTFGSPLINGWITGGLTETETLFFSTDFESQTEQITLTVVFTSYVTGVSFYVLDIDRFVDGFNILQSVDEIEVTGFHTINNATVTPTLTATNPSSVTVSGNVATGTWPNIGNNLSDGNVLVNFGSAPLNEVRIVYRSGAAAPSNPGGQGLALHNINFTPSSPTAVSLQTLSASAPLAFNYALAGVFVLTFVTFTLLHRRRQLRVQLARK